MRESSKKWCVCASNQRWSIVCLSIFYLLSFTNPIYLLNSVPVNDFIITLVYTVYCLGFIPSLTSYLLLWFVIQSWTVVFVLKYTLDKCYCVQKNQNKLLSCIVWFWLIGLLPFGLAPQFESLSDVYVPLTTLPEQSAAIGYFMTLCVIQFVILYLNVKELKKFVPTFVSIFLSILDLSTDIALIVQWYTNDDFAWCILLGTILIFSQIISTFKWSTNDNKNILQSIYIQRSNVMTKFDYFMSIIGLGRSWMGSKSIATNFALKNELTGMKINEIQFESMPSVCLQLYVILTQYYISNKSINYTVASIVSLCVSALSMTFSIWLVFKSNVKNYKYTKQGQGARDGDHTVTSDLQGIELTIATPSKSQDRYPSSPKSIQSISSRSRSSPRGITVNHNTEMTGYEYSSFFQCIVFGYVFCDFYCRGFQLVLIFFVNKMALQHNAVSSINVLTIISMTSVMVTVYVVYDIASLRMIRNQKHKINGWVSMEMLQLTFVSLLSNVVNLLFTLPLKTIVQKNNAKRHVFYCLVKGDAVFGASLIFFFAWLE